MSLPRFLVPWVGVPSEHLVVALEPEQAHHLEVLRLKPGDALEVMLPSGVWRAEVAERTRHAAAVRLVAPLAEDREAPIPIEAWLPLTSSLALFDEMLPPAVELGVSRIQPVAYARSAWDRRKAEARMERWGRLIQSSVEQSHRSCVPELRPPLPFEALLSVACPQRWVAYEWKTGARNPALERAPLAFTHGPEGGITEAEFHALQTAGWQPLSLGRSILRAVTCPAAILGAVQAQLN